MQDEKAACQCKGKRACALCDPLNKKARDWLTEFKNLDSYVFCPTCQSIFKGWQVISSCDEHISDGRKFNGLYILPNFLSDSESSEIVKCVDESKWDLSQSGRRKKNFGPKVNFKKKKIRTESFKGFFEATKFVRKKLNKVSFLENFKIIEECFLEYENSRGSHIDAHIDDCWIWGERIVTCNLIGETVLTLTKHFPTYPQQYNIDCIDEYKNELIGELEESIPDDILVRICLPKNSLIVLYGTPRYKYEHSVLKEDVNNRRVCIAYREFTKKYAHYNDQFIET